MILQISDIHLSYVNKMKTADDLQTFCTDTISVIDPALVLVTGDITHAKYADHLFSTQFEEEWDAYQNILKKCHVHERLPWLDMRGNHGQFVVILLRGLAKEIHVVIDSYCLSRCLCNCAVIHSLQTTLMFHQSPTSPIVLCKLYSLPSHFSTKSCCIETTSPLYSPFQRLLSELAAPWFTLLLLHPQYLLWLLQFHGCGCLPQPWTQTTIQLLWHPL